MPVLKRLQTYLDSHKIPYEVVSHDVAFSDEGRLNPSMCVAIYSPKW